MLGIYLFKLSTVFCCRVIPQSQTDENKLLHFKLHYPAGTLKQKFMKRVAANEKRLIRLIWFATSQKLGDFTTKELGFERLVNVEVNALDAQTRDLSSQRVCVLLGILALLGVQRMFQKVSHSITITI